jgi:serine/threonine-protein kinase
MAPESNLPKTVGRYKVVRELGQGAMGRVLLAHDPVLDRGVAIKHLRPDLPLSPEQRNQLLDRMRQEARASARVSHANLVALHDMGEDPGLGLYLVFEYVEGPTLKQKLERGPMGAEAVATIAREVGAGLRLLHEAGVIHRDVKPENVILSRSGAKLTDFGIARVPDSTLTGAGNILGTPAYSAPEAIRNSKFSPFSDQFSLAATLYEALSGRRAFPGDDAVFVATKIANDEPPQIAAVCGVPLTVDTVLARAFAKHPQSRFEDCETFGHALADALGLEIRPTMPTLPDAVHSLGPAPHQRSRTAPVVVALACGAGAMWAAGHLTTRAQPERPTAATVEPPPLIVNHKARAEPEEDVPPVAWLAESPKHRPKSTRDDEPDDAEDAEDPEARPNQRTPNPPGAGEAPAPTAPPITNEAKTP